MSDLLKIIKSLDIKTAVVIMAHPDDETCWAGGLISSLPEIKWHSICCSYPRRLEEFDRKFDYLKACSSLNMCPHQIEKVETDPKMSLDIVNELKDLNINQYDVIITHGKDGDYGHAHHKSIHNQVLSLAEKPVIGTSYTGNYILPLTEKVYDKKMKALKEYKTNSYKIDGKSVEKWEALLYVYPILKNKEEKFEIYYKEDYEV